MVFAEARIATRVRGREEGCSQEGEDRKWVALRMENPWKSLSPSLVKRNRSRLKVLHLWHPLVHRTLASKESR